jgi:sugar lactone lactonase YvrE
MSVMQSKFLAKHSAPKRNLFCLPILALAFCASSGWAQAPAVVIDSQQILANTAYSNPQSIAVSQNGTVYVANFGANNILALTPNLPGLVTPTVVPTGSYVLSGPVSLALDANGDLFVGDAPATGGRIIELTGNGQGGLTGAATVVYQGAPLGNPISLAVDNAGTLFIGNLPAGQFFGGSIYSLAGGTIQQLPITGLNASFTPAALLRDSANHLYMADNGEYPTTLGGIYVVADTGGAATTVPTGEFVINTPSGLAFDAAGDLEILTFLGTGSPNGGTGPNNGEQVVIIPAASPTTPYILPNVGIGVSSGLALDPNGNVDVIDGQNGQVVQLALGPANLGSVPLGGTGAAVQFNLELNQPATIFGTKILTQGDVSTELTMAAGGTCTTGDHTNLGTGGYAISPYFPYTCLANFEGTPSYPGIRSSAVEVTSSATTVLGTAYAYQTGQAAAEVTYPVNTRETARNFQAPEAVAISGLDKTVYVADTQAGVVYSLNGLGGAAPKAVPTGTLLAAPSALALDGAGDLFIADYNKAYVVEVPVSGAAAFVLTNIPTGLLQHPIALAFDYLGNLYIGDGGPEPQNVGPGEPGYIVKVPVTGTAFKMTIPTNVSILFPQALATDPLTANLLIGDGGAVADYPNGQVVQLSANGATATVVTPNAVVDPTGLAVDPADDLYVLDGVTETITAVPPKTAGPQFLVQFNNTALTTASALAISAGGQSFIVANGGKTSGNLYYLNGNASTLSFGDVKVGTPSPAQTATVLNIGNLQLKLGSPYYTNTTGNNRAFSFGNSTTCTNALELNSSAACTINVQFTPQFLGRTTQQTVIDSNAYNTGGPVLLLEGTGTAGGLHRRER